MIIVARRDASGGLLRDATVADNEPRKVAEEKSRTVADNKSRVVAREGERGFNRRKRPRGGD